MDLQFGELGVFGESSCLVNFLSTWTVIGAQAGYDLPQTHLLTLANSVEIDSTMLSCHHDRKIQVGEGKCTPFSTIQRKSMCNCLNKL